MIQLGHGFEPDEVILSNYYNGYGLYLIITNYRLIFSGVPNPNIAKVSYCTYKSIELARIDQRYIGNELCNTLVIYAKNKGQRIPNEFIFTFFKEKGLIFIKYHYDDSKYYLLEEIRKYIMYKLEEVRQFKEDKMPKLKDKFKEIKQPKIKVWRLGTPDVSTIKRKPISNKLKHQVWRRDNFTCLFCGKTNIEVDLEVDHRIPVSKGGATIISNLQTLCITCNRKKGDRVSVVFKNGHSIERLCEKCGKKPRKSRKRCPECDQLVCRSCWDYLNGVCIDCEPDYYVDEEDEEEDEEDEYVDTSKLCELCDKKPRKSRKRCPDCNKLVCSSCWDKKFHVCNECKPDFSELECEYCLKSLGRKNKKRCSSCGSWVHYPTCWDKEENCCKDCS